MEAHSRVAETAAEDPAAGKPRTADQRPEMSQVPAVLVGPGHIAGEEKRGLISKIAARLDVSGAMLAPDAERRAHVDLPCGVCRRDADLHVLDQIRVGNLL